MPNLCGSSSVVGQKYLFQIFFIIIQIALAIQFSLCGSMCVFPHEAEKYPLKIGEEL